MVLPGMRNHPLDPRERPQYDPKSSWVRGMRLKTEIDGTVPFDMREEAKRAAFKKVLDWQKYLKSVIELKRIIEWITGASGTIYAVNLLQHLHRLPDVEGYLVMSAWAKQNLRLETDMKQSELEALADYVYPG